MSKEKQKRADGFEQIEEATISTEQFIEKNQKLLVRGVLVIIIVGIRPPRQRKQQLPKHQLMQIICKNTDDQNHRKSKQGNNFSDCFLSILFP